MVLCELYVCISSYYYVSFLIHIFLIMLTATKGIKLQRIFICSEKQNNKNARSIKADKRSLW